MNNQTFAERLRILRKKNGLTQLQLGALIGVSLKTVQRWENSERQPRLDEIKKLVQALNVSENDLLNEVSPERWVLKIKVADNFEEDFINMTKDMPCVSNISGNPYGATIELSAKWATFSDDELFNDLLQQIIDARESLKELGEKLAPIWSKFRQLESK